MRLYLLAFATIQILIAASSAIAETAADQPSTEFTPESSAQNFITLLRQDKFDDAEAQFDDTMRQAVPVAQLQTIWRAITQPAGAFQKYDPSHTNRVGEFDVVDTPCIFEKSTVTIRVTLDSKRQVAGLYFLPPKSQSRPADEGPKTELKTATGTLVGTLDLPSGTGPWPVVLIIAGSGPTDRDGNSTLAKNDSLRLLGKALAEHGVAALRYDKRGIGESAAAGPAEDKLRFDNYVDDAAAWVKQLRGDPRFSGVAILGHSEGSLIGILAAKQIPIDALISVSGAGRDVVAILREQLHRNLPADQFEKSTHILDELAAGRRVDDVPPELNVLFRPSVQPYMLSWLKYDPAQEIAALEIPILIVQGTTDVQISLDDANLLASHNKRAHLATIANMNHVLKEAPVKLLAAQTQAYSDPSLPLAPHLMEAISAFLQETLPAPQKPHDSR